MLALYLAAFGEAQPVERWRWHFADNPLGPSHIILALAGDTCVGQYAVSPMPLANHGHESRAWIGIDHMVHPGYQGQGLYSRMEAEANATIPDVLPSYAFPNEESYPVFTRKFGWKDLGHVDVWLRPAGLGGLRQRTRLAALLAPGAWLADLVLGRPRGLASLAPVTTFGSEFDDLWRRCRDPLEITVSRSSTFLRWRYAQGPEPYRSFAIRRGEDLLGYVVIKVEKKWGFSIGWVMDILVDPAAGPEIFAESLRLAHRAVRSSCDFLALLEPHPRLRRAVRRGGFVRLPSALLPHQFWFVVKRNGYADDRVDRVDGWYLTWGINDVP